jgi:hypothetical protein
MAEFDSISQEKLEKIIFNRQNLEIEIQENTIKFEDKGFEERRKNKNYFEMGPAADYKNGEAKLFGVQVDTKIKWFLFHNRVYTEGGTVFYRWVDQEKMLMKIQFNKIEAEKKAV